MTPIPITPTISIAVRRSRGEVLLDVRHKYRFGEAVRLTRELAVKLDEALRQEAEKQ